MQILGFSLPDFLSSYFADDILKAIAYAVIYVIIGVSISYVVKTRLRIQTPKNVINLIALGIGAICIYLQSGIPEIAVYLVMGAFAFAEYLSLRFYTLKTDMVYVIESDKTNINVDNFVFYRDGAQLCVALQDNTSTLKRIFLNRKVIVKVNSNCKWTEDYETQLWLCNSYTIYEEVATEAEGEVQTGLKSKIHEWFLKSPQVFLELDLCDAHEYNRMDLVRNTEILGFAVEKLETVMLAYTKLRTLLTAMLIKKHSNVLLQAMKTFEDSIFISKEERAAIRGIAKAVDKADAKIKAKQKESENSKLPVESDAKI